MQPMQPSSYAKDAPRISASDIALIRQSQTKSKYNQLTTAERSVYERVYHSLFALGAAVQQELGAQGTYGLKVTSGFSTRTGVRGYLPKDLWFAVYNERNMVASVGNPQLFMIASHRAIEYGFAASIHPARFSDPAVRERVRRAAPRIFAALPNAGSERAMELQKKLANGWYFRRRARLRPNVQEFPSLDAWLSFLKSPLGAQWAAGCISRYLLMQDLDRSEISLMGLVTDMADIFSTLMTIVT
jgi:hypothetical protein